jgi:hypothetical protein
VDTGGAVGKKAAWIVQAETGEETIGVAEEKW